MSTQTIDDIKPKAVMSEDELRRWEALPAEVQIARLRAAIEEGLVSPASSLSMDDIWARLRARHPDAKL